MINLSVVIPMYNLEKHIFNSLDSLVAQTDHRFEIIVIDDGSTDKSADIAYDLLSQNPVTYKIIKKDNGGVSAARNRGLEEASGKFILFLDGDDIVSNQLVQTLNDHIDNSDHDIISWGFNMIRNNNVTFMEYFSKFNLRLGKYTGVGALKSWFLDKALWISTSSAAYRRKFLLDNKLYYTEGSFAGEDQEFTIKALSRASSVYFIDKVLSYSVERIGSGTNSSNIKKLDIVDSLRRAALYIGESHNTDLKEVSRLILCTSIVENYFVGLHLCVWYSKKNVIEVLKDIESRYPGLNQEMLLLMRKYKGTDIKWQIKFKTFLISPAVCFYILKLLKQTRG